MTTTDAANKCAYCGQPVHPAVCPTVKAIEYHPDGSVKRVEFKTPADYAIPMYPQPAPPWQPWHPWNPGPTCVSGALAGDSYRN